MVTPKESMEAITRAVANEGILPSELSVILEEADPDSSHSNVELPLLEVRPITVDVVDIQNSDFSGFVTDSEGNHVGKVYLSEYEMGVQMNLWTAVDDSYDPDKLGRQLRQSLYPYSSYGPDEDFLDSDGEAITEISHFKLEEGERDDGLLESPTVRRWSQEAELWACERFSTNEDYIADVVYPDDDDVITENV
jgi:hypothetical protein